MVDAYFNHEKHLTLHVPPMWEPSLKYDSFCQTITEITIPSAKPSDVSIFKAYIALKIFSSYP
jgi:hypothetical protein